MSNTVSLVEAKHPADEVIGLPDYYPRPTGYRMLVKPMIRENKRQSGIVLPDEVQQNDVMLNTVGLVLAQGPECYQHDDRKYGAWCQPGDWILFRKHAGTRVKMRNPDSGETEQLIFVADDEILATTARPELVVAYVE